MRKMAALLLILLVSFPVLVAAQDNPDAESDWGDYSTDYYASGDQVFTISLGTVFTTVFISDNPEFTDHNIDPPIGGMGSLVYSYFFSRYFFAGIELSGLFLPTLANHTVFLIPLGIRAGTQFVTGRFEFPVFAAFGMAWHKYLDHGYYGIYARLGAAAFYRVTYDWSFGLTTSWSWFPQRPADSSKNVDGNFLEVTISARYHF